VPGQLFTVAETVMVAVIGAFVVFTAVKAVIFPVPLTPRPIAVLEFVQAKIPPAGLLLKLVAGTEPLLQTLILAGTETTGVGLTVIVYVEGVPVQPFTVGITEMVAVTGELL